MVDTRLFAQLERLLIDRGAALVGCADLGPLPEEVRNGLPRAVCIGVALAPAIVAEIADGPTPQYAAEYERVNELLNRLAEDAAALIGRHGFRAVAGRSTVDRLDPATLATPLPHKTVATLAGLGWIGKCALLVTEDYGSAVRLNSVLTDAPLPVGTPVEEPRCEECCSCVDNCPARASSGRNWRADRQRESFFDAFACCESAQESARRTGIEQTICGICVAVCPHTKRYTNA